MSKKSLKDAQALGELHTMPEVLDVPQERLEISGVIDNPEDFRMAVGNAQLDGVEHLEVSEKLFKYLLKNSKSRYITYGNPGVKVYLAGTKDKYDYEDSLNAEAHHEYLVKEKQKELAGVKA